LLNRKRGAVKNDVFDRRAFLKSAVAGSAAVAALTMPQPAEAQQGAPAPAAASAADTYLNTEAAAFVETLVDHMVPADEFSPKGTDLPES
jgi:gluconate 2-dehydrogenase gamma chain